MLRFDIPLLRKVKELRIIKRVDDLANLQTFTVGELADKITGGDQFAIRGLLRDVGLDVHEYRDDPTEAVPRWAGRRSIGFYEGGQLAPSPCSLEGV